jgi:16S rRNA (adenine1518-N6/adenine1519-N6)-dimethyltransferase
MSLAQDGLPPLREVVATFDLSPNKSLGQNFLFDLNLTGRIARAAGPLDGIAVVEIGPGPGGLTRALLAHGAKKVIAVERDSRCIAALQAVGARWRGRLEILEADALRLNYRVLAEKAEGAPVRFCANLPYNIATALLVGWLEGEPWPPFYERLTLMFQREVALRIVATPAERADYGRLAVLAGWRTKARILFDVPAAAFTPPPKVVSSVVELIPRPDPAPCDLRLLSALTLAAFGQRRKMLRQSLKGFAASLTIDAGDLLAAAGIEETRRAEEINVEGFVLLAQTAAKFAKPVNAAASRVP